MDRVIFMEIATRSSSADRIDGTQGPRLELGARDLGDGSADLAVGAAQHHMARFEKIIAPAARDYRFLPFECHGLSPCGPVPPCLLP